jgi:hypothetical protein
MLVMEQKTTPIRKTYSLSPSLCEQIEDIVQTGKTHGVSLSESMVASLAMVNGLPMVLNNLGFKEIFSDAKSDSAAI